MGQYLCRGGGRGGQTFMVSSLEDMALGFAIGRAGAAGGVGFAVDMAVECDFCITGLVYLRGGEVGAWWSGWSLSRRRILRAWNAARHIPYRRHSHRHPYSHATPTRFAAPLYLCRPTAHPPSPTTAMLSQLRSPLARCTAAARPLSRLYSQTAHLRTTPAASAVNATLVRPANDPVPEAEHKRQMQAPNRQTPWSRSQRPRELGMVGPRFEQTIIEHQVRTPPPFLHPLPLTLYIACAVRCNRVDPPAACALV